jgi:hypothetical protein
LEALACLAVVVLIAAFVRFFYLLLTPGAKDYMEGVAFDVAIQFWDTYLARNLYKGYEWIKRAKNRSEFVKGNIVHIPQSGARPNARRNRTIYPIPVVKRNDTDILYVIDEISTDSTPVFEAEKWELSYQKAPSVIQDHMESLNIRTAQNALYRWFGKNPNASSLGSGNIVRMSGGTTGRLLTGATGTRKLIIVNDIAEAKGLLVEQTKKESNPGKRALFVDEDMYQDLLLDAVFADEKYYKKIGAEFKDGDLVKIHGFDIIRTDVMPRFDNSGTPLAKDSLDETVTNAASDNNFVGLVDFDFVHYAESAVKLFYEADAPEYQADIVNGQNRTGASRERVDDVGVIAIVQE